MFGEKYIFHILDCKKRRLYKFKYLAIVIKNYVLSMLEISVVGKTIDDFLQPLGLYQQNNHNSSCIYLYNFCVII